MGTRSIAPCLRNQRVWRFTILGLSFVLAGVLLLVAGCTLDSTDTGGGSPSSNGTSATPCSGKICSPGSGVSGVSVFVEPDAGVAPVLNAIQGANHTIDVEVYLLTDRTIIQALEDAVGRGVAVRMLLETHPYGIGSTSPQETLDELNAAGVHAQASDPSYHYTHEKAMVIDGATVYIMTCNLSLSGLGGSSSAANREYGIVDTNSADVQGIEAIFNADWNRTSVTLSDPNLVVSPINSRADLTSLIAGAKSSLWIEDEEMYDSASEQAMVAAVKRGVDVEVVLPTPSGSGNSSDVETLRSGGVHVRYLSNPYVHAKLIVADQQLAFVGSENFSSTSLDENREVGLLVSDATAIGTLGHTFTLDWSAGSDAQ
jgi:phosphatidylserine/phosphatidylglycerophosphate/cardiolipin synthase-like enzyme